KRQGTLYNIDQTYWQVVSLRHKEILAESYVALVKKLNDDVQKMINHGVATKGDGLSVSVRVNEAEMALTQVSDGVALSKMLLCQLCGLPVNEDITLADEASENLGDNLPLLAGAQTDVAMANRPELKVLQNTVQLSEQSTKVVRAANLPQVLVTGGYALSNPNTFNGFEKKFGGFWNIGVLVRIPIWNWGDVRHKVNATKTATMIANMELDEARELIELQVNQSNFKVKEAQKKLMMAQSNVVNANENLRMANLAFKEGTASVTTVMEAQTAWQQAQTQRIDAEIGVKLAQVELQKAMGTLQQ
ncbi:MAG: TolC family protein, partial [Muribaculaceae bacterium]|nr:TolC family protein [Muribaculaceae bacterium]